MAFLDDGQQATLFDPVAATLRRRGFRTLRISLGPRGLARILRDTLFYTRVLRLPPNGTDDQLRKIFQEENVVDVQLGEATLARLGPTSGSALALAERALSCARAAPSQMLDKFEVNAQLGRAGVRVPAQIAASDVTAEVAAARLGLPLVVKRRVAEGGRGVYVAPSGAAAEQALSAWETTRADVFFQAYIPGELVMYAALVDPAGPATERCFRATQLQATWGPSARVVMYDDVEVARAGRQIVAILGVRGLAQFDFIRDGAGELWHLDANPRCWGSMLAADAHGAGFVFAYERLLRGGPPLSQPRPCRDADFPVQPHTLLVAAASGSLRRLAAEWREFARFCGAGPGPAYAALLAFKALWSAVARRVAAPPRQKRPGLAARRGPRRGWRRSPPAAPPSGRR